MPDPACSEEERKQQLAACSHTCTSQDGYARMLGRGEESSAFYYTLAILYTSRKLSTKKVPYGCELNGWLLHTVKCLLDTL